ncbi:MAG TPA: protein translocase subunit SecD, partial [Rhodanobacter sp.]|nr:protein translocase subunit SecD [Rhodanobacter sp.]
MSEFPRWKYALVALSMIFGIIYALPNAFIPLPAVQVTANHTSTPIDDALRQKVLAGLTKDRIPTGGVSVQGDHLLAEFPNADVQKNGADSIKALLGDNYTVAFKLQSTVPHWLTAIGANAMPLGLDLQGGVHFLMQVDQSGVVDKLENSYADDIRNQLRARNIRYESVSRSTVAGQGIVVVVRSAEDRSKATDIINGITTGDVAGVS